MTNALRDDDDHGADRSLRSATSDRAYASNGLGAVLNLPVTVKIVLGSSSLTIAQLMALEKGTVIRLDQRIGDPVELQVSGKSLARGELVVQEDDMCFGLKIADIVVADRPATARSTDKVE
jgi:flagellar motor switch protein FliN